jgi:hypothetical protein
MRALEATSFRRPPCCLVVASDLIRPLATFPYEEKERISLRSRGEMYCPEQGAFAPADSPSPRRRGGWGVRSLHPTHSSPYSNDLSDLVEGKPR